MKADYWQDQEGYLWTDKEAAIEFFGAKPFSLTPARVVQAGRTEYYNKEEE